MAVRVRVAHERKKTQKNKYKRLGTLSNKRIFPLHSTQLSESAAFPKNTAALINCCLSNLVRC